MKKALVLGGNGFIGGHLVKRLISEGFWVRSVDIKQREYVQFASETIIGDLSDYDFMKKVIFTGHESTFNEIYQLAADMGGAGYIFTGNNDASVMQNSATINLNLLKALTNNLVAEKDDMPKVFYSSSACVYPEEIQRDTSNPGLREKDAYPANPDSEYGWEKLFSERLYLAYARNFKLNVRIARFHNIYGPEGTWYGGREKSPAAICRKVAMAKNNGEIEIWGDGFQTRSYLYIDDCLLAVRKLMDSSHKEPLNIGSEEMVSINQLVQITAKVADKEIGIRHVPGPLGVRGRNSNNDQIRDLLGWENQYSLADGIEKTYTWIMSEIKRISYSE